MNTGNDLINEAYSAIFQKDYQRAIDLFKKAIAQDHHNPSYYYKLSVTYARNNNLEEALNAIEQAIRLKPDSNFYKQYYDMIQGRRLSRQALSVARQGKLEQASAMLEMAVNLDPLNVAMRYVYASLLFQQERFYEAKNALQELLILDPTHKEAIALLKICKKI